MPTGGGTDVAPEEAESALAAAPKEVALSVPSKKPFLFIKDAYAVLKLSVNFLEASPETLPNPLIVSVKPIKPPSIFFRSGRNLNTPLIAIPVTELKVPKARINGPIAARAPVKERMNIDITFFVDADRLFHLVIKLLVMSAIFSRAGLIPLIKSAANNLKLFLIFETVMSRDFNEASNSLCAKTDALAEPASSTIIARPASVLISDIMSRPSLFAFNISSATAFLAALASLISFTVTTPKFSTC